MKRRPLLSLTAVAALGVLALTACSGGSSGSGSAAGGSDELAGLTGQIGSKDFSEQYILAHITTQLLNARGADVEANTKLVGSATCVRLSRTTSSSGTGSTPVTSWITYNGNTAPVPAPRRSSPPRRRPMRRRASRGSTRLPSTTPTPSRSAPTRPRSWA